MSQKPERHATLSGMLRSCAARFGTEAAIEEKHGDSYTAMSYDRLLFDAERLGAALREAGLTHKNIIITGENCYLWVVSYLAVTAFCGVAVPLSHSCGADDAAAAAAECDASGIIYSEGCEALLSRLPSETVKICFSDIPHLVEKAAPSAEPDRFGDSIAELAYTSGTAGRAKAVVLTHRNICTTLSELFSMLPASQNDKLYSVLPLSHAYERICGLLYPLSCGACVTYGEGLVHLSTNLRIVRPTAMLCVPVILDSIYLKILANIKKKGLSDKVARAIKITEAAGPLRDRVRQRLFAEIHHSLGGKLSILVTGGSAADEKTVVGLTRFGFRVLQGYGLTETASLISFDPVGRHRKGAPAGLQTPSGLIDIYNSRGDGIGEIRYRGDNVMKGYYKNPELTASVLRDGWLYTGDLGYLDRFGYLNIVGRKANIIMTAKERPVFPEELEKRLLESPFISEAVVTGVMNTVKNDYDIVAVIFPDRRSLSERYGEDFTREQTEHELSRVIASVNSRTENYKKILRFIIRGSEFPKNEEGKVLRADPGILNG